MNILLFTLEYPPFKGGVANYYGNLVSHWNKNDKVFVLHNNDGQLIKNWLWPKWLLAIWQLYKIIRQKKIDHIIVGHILPLGTVTYFLTRFMCRPYTVILHGMDLTYALKTSRKERVTKKILTSAEHIVCASSYTAELTKKFLPNEQPAKIQVVNPGIDISIKPDAKLAEELKLKHHLSGKIILLSLGRLVKRKGVDNVIRALPEILQSSPNLFYIVAGDGPDKIYLKELARGVENIIFLGSITEEEKWAWLNLCDIFITVSRDIAGDFEGFGIVYLEAGLAGKPVIAGASGGISDAVQSAYSGIIVDPENIDRIAGAVIGLTQDAKLRIKLGEQGRERVIKEFNWQKQINRIYNVIHNFI
jgi:phosphatidyl-myo-inositol dimannoside synthase